MTKLDEQDQRTGQPGCLDIRYSAVAGTALSAGSPEAPSVLLMFNFLSAASSFQIQSKVNSGLARFSSEWVKCRRSSYGIARESSRGDSI
jgi:hypothetical protein